MAEHPLVSVIMTTYNAEQYVLQAIESVLNQTLDNIEFLIVDDGSDDGTPGLLEAAKADPRVRVISKERIGRGRALNVAWRNARGSYIANIDADDIAEPNRLETQLKYLQENPEVGLLGTACSIINEDTCNRQILHRPLHNEQLQRILINYNPFVHSSVMMPRHVLEELGGYSESIPVAIDYELWVRIAKFYKVANLPDILATKRVSQTAYFRNRIPSWVRHKAHVFIRWNAWKNHPAKLLDLRFVAFPLGRYVISRIAALLKHKSV
jgi:glycosyltransferase EpsE